MGKSALSKAIINLLFEVQHTVTQMAIDRGHREQSGTQKTNTLCLGRNNYEGTKVKARKWFGGQP